MSDRIGVLGEATTASVATTTAYTVPSAKAARCKIMFYGQAHATNSTGDLTITVNGIAVATISNMTAANYVWTTNLLISNANAAVPTGASAAQTVAPAPFEYYLSAGDTVTYTVGTDAMQSINVQVVGTEIDV